MGSQIWTDGIYGRFSFTLTRGDKLNSHLMASCVRNIRMKNYENLIIFVQVRTENVRDVFFETQSVTVSGVARNVNWKRTRLPSFLSTILIL